MIKKIPYNLLSIPLYFLPTSEFRHRWSQLDPKCKPVLSSIWWPREKMEMIYCYPSTLLTVSPNNAIKNRFFNLTLTLNINLHLYFSWEQSTKKYSWILIFKINITSLRTRNKFGFVFAALLHKWGRSYNYTGPSHSDECTIYKCISPQPPRQ